MPFNRARDHDLGSGLCGSVDGALHQIRSRGFDSQLVLVGKWPRLGLENPDSETGKFIFTKYGLHFT